LDTTLRDNGVVTFNGSQTVVWGDFTKQVFTEKFKTIVGNPPYVKQRSGNLYLKFIELCFGLLDTGGELIFIVPSDFIKLTSAAPIIKAMTAVGSFTDFLFPNDEKLFDGASVDVVIFRYEHGLMSGISTVNGLTKTINISDGIITFSDGVVTGTRIADLFDVAVGFVSGKDSVYKVPIGNVEILSDQGKVDKFIVTEAYPSGNAAIDAHLLKHKAALLERKIKKFTEKNWWAWGALRNKTTVEAALGRPCIYVRNMTRQDTVAFSDKVRYFGGGLLCLVPKKSMTAAEMTRIVGFLNSTTVRKDYLYSGRFKIGHKQVCNIMVPNLG
jgi:adenine-specific DNA-methyltransferase